LAKKPPRKRVMARVLETRPEEPRPTIRRATIVFAVAILAVIAISIVVGLYFTVWQDLWSPAIRVNDKTFNMDYVIRRMKYLDKTTDVVSMMTTITEEELVRQGAPRYGIEVTQEEIDELLRAVARGDNETISESEFREWYRNVLNETKLSEGEYTEWITTYIMVDQLNAILTDNVPTVAEHAHLYIIVLPSAEATEEALARLEEGEDFSELARELSLDEASAEHEPDEVR